jgi:hypothetical protein
MGEEHTKSESRKSLMGANAKVKANAVTAIPELIQIATNPDSPDYTYESLMTVLSVPRVHMGSPNNQILPSALYSDPAEYLAFLLPGVLTRSAPLPDSS